jgi:hypothetical protein
MAFESFSNNFIGPLLSGVTGQFGPKEYGNQVEDETSLNYFVPSFLTGGSKGIEDLVDLIGRSAQSPVVGEQQLRANLGLDEGPGLRDIPVIGEKITNPEGVFDVGTQLGGLRKQAARATDNRVFLEDLGQMYDSPQDLLNPNAYAGALGYLGSSLAGGEVTGLNKAFSTGVNALKLISPVKGLGGSILANAGTAGIMAAPSIYTETKDPGKTLQGVGAAAGLGGVLGGVFDNPKAQLKKQTRALDKELQNAKIMQLQERTQQATQAQDQKGQLDELYQDWDAAQQTFPEVFEKGGKSSFITDFQKRATDLASGIVQGVTQIPGQIKDSVNNIIKNHGYTTELGSEMLRRESPIAADMLEQNYNKKNIMVANYLSPPVRDAFTYITKKLPKQDSQKILLDLVNGKADEVYNYLGHENPLTQGIQAGMKALREIGDEERLVGKLTGEIENYFPIEWDLKRAMKDPAWQQHYEINVNKIMEDKSNAMYSDLESLARKNISLAQEGSKQKLTKADRMNIIAETLDRGRQLFRTDKSRATKEIPANLAKYLRNPLASLENRVQRGVDSIVDERMLMDLRPDFQIGPDIGRKMKQLYGGQIPNASELAPEELANQIALKKQAREQIHQEVYNDLARSGRLGEIKSENIQKVQQAEQMRQQATTLEGQLNNLRTDTEATIADFDIEIKKHNDEIASLLEQKQNQPTEEIKTQLSELRKNKKAIQSAKKKLLTSAADEEMALREQLSQTQPQPVPTIGEDIQREVRALSVKQMRQNAYKEYMRDKGFVQDAQGSWNKTSDIGMQTFNNTKYVEAADTLNKMEGGGKNTVALAKMLETFTANKADPRMWIEKFLVDSFLSPVTTAATNLAELPNILEQNGGFRTAIPALVKGLAGHGIKLSELGLHTRESASKNFMTMPFRGTTKLSRTVNANTAWEDIQQQAKGFLMGTNKEATVRFAKKWEPYFNRHVKKNGEWTKESTFQQFVIDAANGRMTDLTHDAILSKVFNIEPRMIDKTLLSLEHGANPLVRGLNMLKQYTIKQAGELRKDFRKIDKEHGKGTPEALTRQAGLAAKRIALIGGGLGLVKALTNQTVETVTGKPDDRSMAQDFSGNLLGAAVSIATPARGLWGSAYDISKAIEPAKGPPQDILAWAAEQVVPGAAFIKDASTDVADLRKMIEMGKFNPAALKTPYYTVPYVKPFVTKLFKTPAREQLKEDKKAFKKEQKKQETKSNNPFDILEEEKADNPFDILEENKSEDPFDILNE